MFKLMASLIWVKHLSKAILRNFYFSSQGVGWRKCLRNDRRVFCFFFFFTFFTANQKRSEEVRQSLSACAHVDLSACRAHPSFSYVYRIVNELETPLFLSLIWDTPSSWPWIRKLHAVSCVLWLVLQAACEQKAFILLQLPHPGKVFFSKGEHQLQLGGPRRRFHKPR